ncbi:gamma-glutamylcyclotransferase family protein [Pararhodobacter sp.]|uniref:gamma-glutamylcyclotransferase family protein n=1 Tax=Pararhodobacter sp. TaxID=2127056 RepID=UPI002AFEE4F7|nr:gamma-glutamylcyclotransferase family protein [Pararhodobacter sp.]
MTDPFFFGYGSLVNRDTHDYDYAFRARLKGWRRAWRHTRGRAVPFLTGVPCAKSEIDGLVALVPGANWAALDLREEGYGRHLIGDGLAHEANHPISAQIYAVPPASMVYPEQRAPILLSYLDVVIQGYLREFGEAGALAFFNTTDGWETPVRDDRAAPIYPRHQRLSASERGFVDDQLRALGVVPKRG